MKNFEYYVIMTIKCWESRWREEEFLPAFPMRAVWAAYGKSFPRNVTIWEDALDLDVRGGAQMGVGMRIERVDDKTVKCFLSNEELEEYDIDYKDFILRSDKAREIVQEIIEQAEEMVGYKPPKFAFDLQIMMLPDQGLLLTFSEREPEAKEGDQFIECLKEMKRILQKTREKLGQVGTGEQPAENAGEANVQEGEPQKQQENRPGFAVFVFTSIGKVMDYASVLPTNLQVESALYEMNGLYYLYLLKGRASYERYSRACIQALEFSALYAANEEQTIHLKEHGQCLIAEKAVKKLRG